MFLPIYLLRLPLKLVISMVCDQRNSHMFTKVVENDRFFMKIVLRIFEGGYNIIHLI